MYSSLYVFDFDGTIFGTPMPPDGWVGGWWSKIASLEHPHVPDRPSKEWYNTKIVSLAKRAISASDILAVVITNRLPTPELTKRITSLLKQGGMNFDEVHLVGKTGKFGKGKRIDQILAENPSIMELQVWEDWNHDLFRTYFTTIPTIESTLHKVPRFLPPIDREKEAKSTPARVGAKSTLKAGAKYKSKKKIDTDDGEKVVYEYSDRQKSIRHNRKAERLEELKGSLSELRREYKADLDAEDPKERLTALAVALIDTTYERVGNESSANERGHYGVTGWEVRHVTLGKGKATIKYVGKSGVKQEKVVEDAKILSALKDQMGGKSDKDCLFYYEDKDRSFKVSASDVNEYLKPYDISAKDLRGLHANREMCERLSAIRKENGKLPKNRDERKEQLKSEFERALEEAADAVGHEPATLRTNYLVPSLEDHFLKHGETPERWDE
jgi:hypothetical protein